MAYIPTYQISYTNEQMNIVVITLSEKDGEAESVTTYAVSSHKHSYNGEEGKFNAITGLSFECEFFVDVDETDPTPILVQAKKDTWKVDVTLDDKPFFSGFLVPDEGGTPFQDLPYNVKITATDGIGLLKEVTIPEGTFTTHHSLIEYVSYCLRQTGLELPIRVIDNIYHDDMLDRTDGLQYDFFSQAFLEYRTFLKDATTFETAYDVLDFILKENYRLNQEEGEWRISRLGRLQHEPTNVYGTLYDTNGENPAGFEITENYATVGKQQLIYPHGEDQIKYIKRAVKSSRLIYNYEIWPELPKNNKFERGSYSGTTLAQDDSDMDGDGDFTETIGVANNYTINDWEWGEFAMTDHPDFTMSTTGVTRPLVRKVFNDYDLEIIREISIPASPTGIVTGIKSEVIPVVQGDRIKISIDKRYSQDIEAGENSFSLAAIVYIIPTGGGEPWYLLNSFTNPAIDGNWYNQFIGVGTVAGVFVRFGDVDARRYTSVTVESQPIPVTGDMRVIIVNPIDNAGVRAYYRNFELEYLPMVAGGFQKVKGDYEIITQSLDYVDKGEAESKLSDNIHKVFKGCLLDADGVPLTADFYRYGVDESKSYKRIGNFSRFNFEHRRMAMIEGSFTSLMYAPENNQEYYYPISFHKQYRFSDIPGADKRFALCAPLEMDMVKGWLTARFWEIYDADYEDGEIGGTEEFKFIF